MPTFLEKLADGLSDFRHRFMRPVGVTGFNAGNDPDQTEEAKLPVSPVWFVNCPYGQPRGVNILEVRQFAASCWVQMITRYIARRFYTTPFSFVNVDEEDENPYEAERKTALDFFTKLNANGETVIESLIPTLTDLTEIDAGVLIKRYSVDSYADQTAQFVDETGKLTGDTQTMRLLKPLGQRTLNELWYGDGSTFLKQLTIHRQLMGYFQYSWKYPMAQPVFFEKDEVSYWSMAPSSYRGYGFSPLQTVLQVVEVLIQSTRWNKDFFKNNAIPSGIVGLEGVSDKDIDKIQRKWQAEFKGKPHKLFIQNGKATYQPLLLSAREMEWLDGQQWYMHLIFGAYGISPEECGYTDAAHGKSVQEGQQQVSAKNGIEPFFKYAEMRILNDVLPDVLQLPKSPIKLVWDHQDTEKQTRDHTQSMDKIDKHVYTINEVRAKEGLDPVEWGDEPMQKQQQDQQLQADAQNAPPKPPAKDKPKKGLRKLDARDAAVVEESEDYGSFFEKQVKRWEEETVKAVSKVELDKTFGEFLQHMTTAINASPFLTRVRKYIKDSMTEGHEQAEEELGVNVVAGQVFNNRVKALENQQLDGYTINGAKWHGIKGATAELRLDVLKVVEEGVKSKKSRDEIAREVRDVFQGSTMAQAKRITRTETTRFINEGKLSAYKASEIEGRKAWSCVPVSCCDECEEMEVRYNKGIEFDEDFVTKDGRALPHPPLHPHCRCVVEYRE